MTKKILFTISLLSALALFSCKQTDKESVDSIETSKAINLNQYENFGADFTTDNLLSTEEMRLKYESMQAGDSIEVSFKTKVKEVCQKKGCWIKLDLGDNSSEAFVKFKDYKFFVPKDAAEADAIVKGVAYKAETSVAELRHYAEDAGKSEEEVAAITEPKLEYTFLADGIFLKK